MGRDLARPNVRPLDTAAPRDDEEGCPVCPGGIELPFPYEAAVFENRFPSFVAEPPPPPPGDLTAPSYGRCELVIYTSRHDTCFGRLAPSSSVGYWPFGATVRASCGRTNGMSS